MTPLRHLIRLHPAVTALVVTAALALRVLVPGGFMPAVDAGRIVVQLCNGVPDGPGTMTIAVPGMKHRPDPATTATGKCAYADLAQAMTGRTDPILSAAAVAPVLSRALAHAPGPRPREAARLRPPRGPPLAA